MISYYYIGFRPHMQLGNGNFSVIFCVANLLPRSYTVGEHGKNEFFLNPFPAMHTERWDREQ